MKKFLLGLLAVVAVAVIVVLGLATTKPDTVHVERSTVMAATPADVYPFVNDFTEFPKWSPWQKRNPNVQTQFSDPTSGVGAWYSWKGNADVGEGKMTILTSSPTQVTEDLEFIAPMAGHATVALEMQPEGDGTKVTWGYDQAANFGSKVMAVFVNMDDMIGPDFAEGLANLQTLAEKAAEQRKQAEAQAAEQAAAADDASDDAGEDEQGDMGEPEGEDGDD